MVVKGERRMGGLGWGGCYDELKMTLSGGVVSKDHSVC